MRRLRLIDGPDRRRDRAFHHAAAVRRQHRRRATAPAGEEEVGPVGRDGLKGGGEASAARRGVIR